MQPSSSKDDKAARIVFSTYPTMLAPSQRQDQGRRARCFRPSLLILSGVDLSHRKHFSRNTGPSFDYFDAILVGLTATPKTDVRPQILYDFFEMEHGIPTYAYDYDTAVYTDHVLVPYYNYEVKTKLQKRASTTTSFHRRIRRATRTISLRTTPRPPLSHPKS